MAAGALEKFLRDRAATAEVDSARQQVAAALDPLIAKLRTTFGSPASAAPMTATSLVPVNPAQARESAAQLNKLLSEFDPGAADFIEANHAALRPLFAAGTWPQFEMLVQSYSFADAQVELETALKSFPTA
jgi:hypothetical protein